MTDSMSRAVNILMGALKHVTPAIGNAPIVEWGGARASKRRNVYRYDQRILSPLEDGAECLLELVPGSAGYPATGLTEHLIQILLNAKDLETQRATACAEMRIELEALVQERADLGEWEVVLGIQGVELGNQELNVGSCTMKTFLDSDVNLWDRRIASGKYIPPPDTVVIRDGFIFGGIENLANSTVAYTRVKAIDVPHAAALATKSVEESLDLLRSILVAMGAFDRNPPKLGIAIGPSRDSGLYFRHDKPYASHTYAHPGTERYAQLINSIPGHKELDRIIKVPEGRRNDLERRVAVALQWMGQATLTPFGSVRFVCLATAVEALLLLEGETRGVTDKFTKRGAWILGDDAAGRTEKAKFLNECYGIRSACVHGRGSAVTERKLTSWAHAVYAIVFKLLTQPRFSGITTGDVLVALINGWELANPIVT